MLARRLLLAGGGGSFPVAPEDDEVFHGVNAKFYDGTVPLSQTIADQVFTAVKYNYTGPDQRCYDTDDYHPHNTESNLSGTVAKTASSATIVGTGTSFLSQLAVGDAVRIVGGENTGYTPEIFVVQSIADNTHFTAYQAAVNSASGVTGVKDTSVFRIPPGMDGYYAGRVNINFRFDGDGIREINIAYNGMEAGFDPGGSNNHMDEQDFGNATSAGEWADTIPWGPVPMVEGDFVQVVVWQSSGGSLEIAADLPGIPFSMWRVGT